ncbi:hypothetical protein CHS0354_003575 [Potamilus streckersoni]|uniref:Sushi domain-containing protein n=1 Tax=Potamilus streckersoni TaxID=2493646 RepID=A0AAE0SM77_9BIVA|nr:hypothetical protein CHS0354_003575 [Potamilus streckersoni]
MLLKSMCLLAWCLLGLKMSMLTSIKLRTGDTGKYVYNNSVGYEYCYYCPPQMKIFEDDVANQKYQVNSCIEKNYPFSQKLDQAELNSRQYPVCNTGTKPSCNRPKDPERGSWICESSEGKDLIPVYTTCTIMCNPGYRAIREESIYCNESRTWDPSGETACINASGSEGVYCLALYVSAAAGFLICILVTIICCRRKRQGLKKIFSRMEKGIEQSLILGKEESVKDNTMGTFEKGNTTILKQDSQEYISIVDTNVNIDVDNSSIEPLLPTEKMGETLSSPGRNAVEHDDQPSDANTRDGASKNKLNTGKDTDNRSDADRLEPEGQSFSTNGGNKQPVLPPGGSRIDGHNKEQKDPEETLSKEFERDPFFCNKKVYEDLIRELEIRSEKWLCQRIVEYFEEMEEHNLYLVFNQDDQRHHVFARMRKRDVRIGHIVYYISGVQSQNKTIVLQKIQKFHPNCNFCESLYGDMK